VNIKKPSAYLLLKVALPAYLVAMLACGLVFFADHIGSPYLRWIGFWIAAAAIIVGVASIFIYRFRDIRK